MSPFDDHASRFPATGELPPAPVPEHPSLTALREAIDGCRACELWAEALEAAGIARDDAYVSNVVKHFRYKQRGKRRIHQTPERIHVAACRPWLEAELAVVRPRALVLLGATAAQALLGPQIRIGHDRGISQQSDLADLVTLTAHPSSILRVEGDRRAQAKKDLVADLSAVARWLADHRPDH